MGGGSVRFQQGFGDCTDKPTVQWYRHRYMLLSFGLLCVRRYFLLGWFLGCFFAIFFSFLLGPLAHALLFLRLSLLPVSQSGSPVVRAALVLDAV